MACWLTSLQDFLACHKIHLEVTKAKLIGTSREGDHHLMDDFRALQIFNDDELLEINLCQIFLQVTALSNVTDAACKYIHYPWKYLRARDLPIIFLFTSGPDNQW